MDGLIDTINRWGDAALPKIEGLLGDPTFNLGVGLLGQAGPQPYKQNFGQALQSATGYANNRQSQFNQLQAQREAIQERKRRADAMKQVQGLISNPASSVPAAIRAPGAVANEQSKMMGLLATANPEAYSAGLLGQAFSSQNPQTSSGFADFIAMGGDPNDMKAFQEFSGKGPDPYKQIAANLQIEQLNRAREEADLTATQRQQNERRRTRGASASVNEIASIIDLLEGAEGTAAQPGYFANAIKSGSSIKAGLETLFGGSSDSGKVAESLEKMEKGFTRLSTSTIPDAFLGSNNKLNLYSQQLPSTELQLGSNLSILDSYLEGIINEDFVDDGELNSSQEAVKLRERIQKLIAGQQEGQDIPPPPAGFTVVSP